MTGIDNLSEMRHEEKNEDNELMTYALLCTERTVEEKLMVYNSGY